MLAWGHHVTQEGAKTPPRHFKMPTRIPKRASRPQEVADRPPRALQVLKAVLSSRNKHKQTRVVLPKLDLKSVNVS